MVAARPPFTLYDYAEVAEPYERLRELVLRKALRHGLSHEVPFFQLCGYPLVRSHARTYAAVARPEYALPFCDGATHRSLIVVRDDAPAASLEDLRGGRFALNTPDSNTGMNLPRALFAPLAKRGRFFGSLLVSGSHAASLSAVARGEADAAAIDSVSYGLLATYRPAAIARVRILGPSASGPTPPFVTTQAAGEETRRALYAAFREALDDPDFPPIADAIFLRGIEPATLETYEPLLALERDANALGYSVIA